MKPSKAGANIKAAGIGASGTITHDQLLNWGIRIVCDMRLIAAFTFNRYNLAMNEFEYMAISTYLNEPRLPFRCIGVV